MVCYEVRTLLLYCVAGRSQWEVGLALNHKLLCNLTGVVSNQYKRHSTALQFFPVLKWHHKVGLVLEYQYHLVNSFVFLPRCTDLVMSELVCSSPVPLDHCLPSATTTLSFMPHPDPSNFTYILPSLATTPSFIPPPVPSRVIYLPSPDSTPSFIPPGYAPSYLILLPTAPSFISPPSFYLTQPSHQLQRQGRQWHPYHPHPLPPYLHLNNHHHHHHNHHHLQAVGGGYRHFQLDVFVLCCVVLKRKELLADVPVCASVKTLVRCIPDTHTYSPI